MITNEEVENILLDEYNHTCLVREDNYNFQITPHIKLLKKNMLCIYNEICDFNSNKIIKPINLINDKIEIFFVKELKKAFFYKEYAFYENFMSDEQYLLYPNRYSGIHKEYVFYYLNCDGYLREEYFHINGKIDGIKKIYDSTGDLIREENYVNGKLNGITKIYENNNIVEIRNYFNKNYYYVEFYKFDKIIYSGYYYLDINITPIIKLYNLFR
jgi:antitoxin component YwqK of YwqJK toxin-antitoxin module